MTYVAHGEVVTSWYASLHANATWNLGLVKGVRRDHVASLLPGA